MLSSDRVRRGYASFDHRNMFGGGGGGGTADNFALADDVTGTIGTGNDLSVVHNGTNTVFTSTTGNLIFDNTNETGKTQMQLGTDTSATGFEVLNNTGDVLFSVDGAGTVTPAGATSNGSSGAVQLSDGSSTFTSGNLVYTTGTDTLNINSATGEYQINGTNVLTPTTLGSAVVSSSLTSLGTLTSLALAGDVTLGDNNSVIFGAGSDLSVVHNGTNSVVTSTTGNLLIDNTSPTGKTQIQLGTDTSATGFEVLNNTGDVLFSVDGAGTVTPAGATSDGSSGAVQLSDGSSAFTSGNLVYTTGTDTLNINSATGEYQINGTNVLTPTTLGSAVVSSSLTSVGTLTSLAVAGDVTLGDSNNVIFGAGSDLTVTHNGTNSVVTSTTGNLLIDNTNTTGKTQIQLGTDTSATGFEVLNNTGDLLFEVSAEGVVGTGQDTGALSVSTAQRGSTDPGEYNTVFGHYTPATSSTSTAGNAIFGYSAGNALAWSSGGSGDYACNNTFVGCAAGRLSTTGFSNTAVGSGAMGDADTTGSSNTAVGLQCGFKLTTGSDNTFLGESAGYGVTTATGSVAIGHNALINTGGVTGSYNIAVGDSACDSINTGARNIGIGQDAMKGATSTDDCIGIGYQSCGANAASTTTGNWNVCLGLQAGTSITNGQENTFIGLAPGYEMTTGDFNVGIGTYALYEATTAQYCIGIGSRACGGSSASAMTGDNNICLGREAGEDITTGYSNIFMGIYSGSSNTTGFRNVCIGEDSARYMSTGYDNVFIGPYAAGYNTATGDRSVCVGQEAGARLTSGRRNVFLGAQTGDQCTTGGFNLAIGYRALDQSNHSYVMGIGLGAGFGLTLSSYDCIIGGDAGLNWQLIHANCDGNSSTRHFSPAVDNAVNLGEAAGSRRWKEIFCVNGTINTSEGDQKKDVHYFSASTGMDIIKLLKPCCYRWKDNTSNRIHYGLVAQDVKTAIDKLGISQVDFAPYCEDTVKEKVVVDLKDEDGNQRYDKDDPTRKMQEYQFTGKTRTQRGLRYNEFIAPIIAAIQDLDKRLSRLEVV